MSANTFIAAFPSRQTPEQQCRVLVGRNSQAHATPLDTVTCAGDQVLDFAHAAPTARRPNLDVPEMEPELDGTEIAQCDRHGDGVVVRSRLLHEAYDVRIVDLCKPQIGGLL